MNFFGFLKAMFGRKSLNSGNSQETESFFPFLKYFMVYNSTRL